MFVSSGLGCTPFNVTIQACCEHVLDYSFCLPYRVLVAYISVSCLLGSRGLCQNVRLWRRRLQHLSQSTLPGFSSMMQRQFAVYALLHVKTNLTGHNQWLSSKNFYVGSAKTGIHSRQDARSEKISMSTAGTVRQCGAGNALSSFS